MTASWSLVSLIHGDPVSVLPFVAHHLHSDAQHLHLYLDAPAPGVEQALATRPRCIVTVCTPWFWRKLRPLTGRPAQLAERQIAILRHARAHAASDWLVHLDSDEFLVHPDPSLPLQAGAALQEVPRGHDWTCILPCERVLGPHQKATTIFDGLFRMPTRRKPLLTRIYGDSAPYLTQGVTGHSRGKPAFRRDTTLHPRIHDVIHPPAFGRRQKAAYPPAELPHFTTSDSLTLLHFEGWTTLHWMAKLFRYIEAGQITGHNAGRNAAKRFLMDHPDPATRRAFAHALRHLPQGSIPQLEQAGLLRRAPFDPAALTRATFPDIRFDFTVEGFDAGLRAADPAFFRRHGL